MTVPQQAAQEAGLRCRVLVDAGVWDDCVTWTAQDSADYADGQLAEALRQLRTGELGEEYVPSDEDLAWARRELGDPAAEKQH